MKIALVVLVCCVYGYVFVHATKSQAAEEMEGSGSGDESSETKSTKVTTTTTKSGAAKPKPHHHHHHHHHHHGHHHHHHHHHKQAKKAAKKSDTAAATATATKKTNEGGVVEKEEDSKLIKKTVGELAQTPLSKLMTLFKKGGVRTDIADQTIALLNASITNQNDLAEAYKKEEGIEETHTAEGGDKKSLAVDPTLKSITNMTQGDLAEISQKQESMPNKKSKSSKAKGKGATKKTETGDDKHDKQSSKEYDEMSEQEQRRADAAGSSNDSDKKGDKKSGEKKEDMEKSEKKNKKSKKDEIAKDVAKKTNVEYDIPNTIPSNCQKLVKNYANGEMTLKDYLKSMKLCKSNEETAAKLADTTPAQREAVNTMTMIQHEAYKYAMDSMRNFKSSSKDAESVMDQWRSNSFGAKAAVKKSDGIVPDAVKKFMTMQTPPGVGKLVKPGQTVTGNVKSLTPAAKVDATKVAPVAVTNKESLAKSAIAAAVAASKMATTAPLINAGKAQITKKSNIFQPLLKTGKLPANLEESLIKKSLIAQVPLINKKLLTKNMFLPNSVLNANLVAKKSVIQQKMLLAQMISKGLIDKTALNPQVLKNVAKFTIPHRQSPLNPANLPENIIEHPVPLPSEKTLIQADQTDKIASAEKKSVIPKEKLPSVEKLTELDKAKPETKLLLGGVGETKATVPSSLAAAVEKIKNTKDQKIPDISSSKIIKELTGKANAKDLTPDKIAAEEFFASLANPVLGNMPVDTNLVAAFKEQTKDSILSDPGKLFQVSRKRRTLRRTRSRHNHTIRSTKQRKFSKRNVDSETGANRRRSAARKQRKSSPSRNKRDTDYVVMLSKRDTTDNLTRSVKPIERSNMGVHISSNQGPKLLDKIRDMSRVIIH